MDFLNAARKNAEGGSPVQQRVSPKPGGNRARHSPAAGAAESQSPVLNGEGDHSAISPFVKFEVFVPESQTPKEEEEVAGDDEEEETPSSPATASGDKLSPAGLIATKRNRVSDFATYLLKKADEKGFEITAGFRFYDKGRSLPGLDLNTLPQAFRWVQGVIDLLKNQNTGPIPAGSAASISLSRSGDNLKVTHSHHENKQEYIFKFEDFAIKLREQVKQWVKLARSVDETILYKEEREKDKKDDIKRRHEKVKEKLVLTGFEGAAKELKKLFANNTTAPKLSAKFEKQQEKKRQAKQQIHIENKSMMAHVLAAVSKDFLETDIKTLVPKQDEEDSTPSPAPTPEPKTQTDNKKGKKGDKQTGAAGNASPSLPSGGKKGVESPAVAGENKDKASPKPRASPAPAKKGGSASGTFLSRNPYDIGESEEVAETPEEPSKPAAAAAAAPSGSKKNKDKKKGASSPAQPAASTASPKTAPKKEEAKPEQPKPKASPKVAKAATKAKAVEPADNKAPGNSLGGMMTVAGLTLVLVAIFWYLKLGGDKIVGEYLQK